MGFLWEEPPMKKYFVTLTTEERQSLHDLTAGGRLRPANWPMPASCSRPTKPPRGQVPLTAALPGGRRLVPPGPSGRGRELPLGFEPVVPIGADGLAPRQPEVVGVERDRLGGGTPALSPGAEGRRNATRLDRLRLGTARDLALQVGDRRLELSPPRGRPELAESAPPDRLPYRLLIRPGNAWLL